MPNLLKHLIALSFALSASLTGYHLMVSSGTAGGAFAPETLKRAVREFSLSTDYRLSDLELLERDLYRVESRYVEKERLDPEVMFQGALQRVQREVAEVMFFREPQGSRLHVSVGSFSTVLMIEPIRDFGVLYQELVKVADVMEGHLSDEIERREVEYALMNGILSTLDPHTVLLPPVIAREFEVDNQGEFGGLGIKIMMKQGRLTVEVPIEGTPAFRAGMKPQDHIVRIEGESTINMDLDDAVSKLRGEIGSPVNIMVMRKGFASPRRFTIVRERIRVNPMEAALLEGNVGYIRIKSFSAKTGQDLNDELARLHREAGEGLRGLVLDMRMNPGGFLNQAIEVADKFLTDGVIVSTVEGASGERAEQRAQRAGTEPNYPMVVLVNGTSASASEIVAGALRNQGRAVVVGERTYGKGSVQHLYRHKDDSRLKLTVAKFLSPGDKTIQSHGVPADIRLIPSVVETAKAQEEEDPWGLEPLPSVSLYWREWIDREADSDRHLKSDGVDEPPVYSTRYYFEQDDEKMGASIDPQQDWEVQFAREVVLSAPNANRADMLRDAASVVERHQKQEAERLVGAFDAVGIDWANGTNPEEPQIDMRLDFGQDGVLQAGVEEHIRLFVTNKGEAPLFQISAVTKSENPWLDRREFYLGRIDPGETRSYIQRVAMHQGYGNEEVPVEVVFQDTARRVLAKRQTNVVTVGKALPRVEYALVLKDDGSGKSRGDGDGRPEVGEVIDFEITVKNVGEGSTGEAYARLKNRSGRALDLRHGGVEIGKLRRRDGTECKREKAGCRPVVLPGETFVARMTFALPDMPEDGSWDLELQVGDHRAYDYASIQRGGFFEFFQFEEKIALSPDSTLPTHERKPPQIEISRAPSQRSPAEQIVISGEVLEDENIRDVIIFHGEDKVFYRGGEENTRTLPFTVEREVKPGANNFYVLARDQHGLTATVSLAVWGDKDGS